MTETTMIRKSIGTQLRETLDEMQRKGQIREWKFVGRGAGEPCYDIKGGLVAECSFLPGEAMDWVNSYGYDVRFGKAPNVPAPMLTVHVELMNDNGDTIARYADGFTVDHACAAAEAQQRSETGDASWTVNEWSAA